MRTSRSGMNSPLNQATRSLARKFISLPNSSSRHASDARMQKPLQVKAGEAIVKPSNAPDLEPRHGVEQRLRRRRLRRGEKLLRRADLHDAAGVP